jgi:hypothetical protein
MTASHSETLTQENRAHPAARRLLSFMFWTILFGIAYTQPRLYYSNQNQYFLHGLAQGGQGFLNADWLANSTDPTPVFSYLVAATYRYGNEALFYFYFILLLGVYFHALFGIFLHLSGRSAAVFTRLRFMALIVAVHAGMLRWISAQLFGVDYPWFFQAGVANQYVLGAGLQPSVFGVLLVLSISTFLHDRPFWAVTWSSLAAVWHSTYLLASAFLTISYLYLLFRERRVRQGALIGAWALLLVTPVVIYNVISFAPSSWDSFQESQRLLAHFRIPHHTEVERWLDSIACAQLGWILVAAWLVRGTRLFAVGMIAFGLALSLTVLQLATNNDTLALLFPWRISAVLVPIATAIILTRLLTRFSATEQTSSAGVHFGIGVIYNSILALAVFGGAVVSYLNLGYRTNEQEIGLMEYVRDRKAHGDRYLLPVEVPELTSGKRGASSLSFTPPPRREKQHQVISVDLQRFRLFTGVPIFIDFKSIPYKDVELLEWHRRLLWNERFYEHADWIGDDVRRELLDYGITHVVMTSDRDVPCDALVLIYEDAFYRVYQVGIR